MARPAISSATLLSRSLAVTVLEKEGSHAATDSVLERSHFNDARHFGVYPSLLIFLSFFLVEYFPRVRLDEVGQKPWPDVA